MILVVDNYDSFTFNLVQMLLAAEVDVVVLRNDAESAAAMLDRRPRGIILSPGPGRPEDAGVCLELLALRPAAPLLGVCLGHQALGMAFGAEVGQAAQLMHGKTSLVRHDGKDLFSGVSNPFVATRYHSLDVREDSLPQELEPTAWSEDGGLMAMRHRHYPYRGVQFHPESILTIEGSRLVDNFLRHCAGEPEDEAGD